MYEITISKTIANGAIGIGISGPVKEGTQIYVNVYPEKGYWLTGLSYKLADEETPVDIDRKFLMPEANIELNATFEKMVPATGNTIADDFINMVKYIGEANILGFSYDNSAGVLYPNGFTLDEYFIPEINTLMSIETDFRGNLYCIYKHIETVQSIIVRHATVTNPGTAYDRISLRG